MHPSSIENMRKCRDRYVRSRSLAQHDEVVVLDVGGADVNGSYRQVFDGPGYSYLTAELAAGEGVDVVLENPNRLPLADASIDIVVSGQMLEHCEFFWLVFAEMIRVLKPDGFLFLIAPSGGPIHRYPVDCYRFYPDAYRALAKYAGCHLVDVWVDERGPWRDLVGVFSRQAVARKGPGSSRPLPSDEPVPLARFPGNAEEEVTRGELSSLDVLGTLHGSVRPSLYLEIGVRHGHSLALASCPAIGVDPAPELKVPLPATTRLALQQSDDFFDALPDQPLPRAPDLIFIDGMHLFEYALRDFMHVERVAAPGALVAIDDIFPCHPAQAERKRRTRVWTGDVWKLRSCLAELRPDLFLMPLDTAPAGLLLVAGLNPANRVLWNRYNPIVRKYSADLPVPRAVLTREGAASPSHGALNNVLTALRNGRESGASPRAIVARLRAIFGRTGGAR